MFKKCIFDKTYQLDIYDKEDLENDTNFEVHSSPKDILLEIERRNEETKFIINPAYVKRCLKMIEISKKIAQYYGLRLKIYEYDFKDIEIELYMTFLQYGHYKSEFAKLMLLCDSFTIIPIDKYYVTINLDISQADKYYHGRRLP